MTFHHIVVASDLTEASDGVLEVARELSGRLGASTTVIHALTDSALSDMRADLPHESSYDDSIVTRLETELADQVKKAFETTTQTETMVVMGDAVQVVRQVAQDEDADILVIGVRNRSRVGKLILGSTAQELLIGSPCPVLGVPL